jgi:hypothetical protein
VHFAFDLLEDGVGDVVPFIPEDGVFEEYWVFVLHELRPEDVDLTGELSHVGGQEFRQFLREVDFLIGDVTLEGEFALEADYFALAFVEEDFGVDSGLFCEEAFIEYFVELSVEKLGVVGDSGFGHAKEALVLEEGHEGGTEGAGVAGAADEVVEVFEFAKGLLVAFVFGVEVVFT